MFNFSVICRMANALHKVGYSRSNAFITAWAMEKGMTTKVKGVSKENRQTALQHLLCYAQQDVSIRLDREPENLYNQDAIAVIAAVRGRGAYKMGYLPWRRLPLSLHRSWMQEKQFTAVFKEFAEDTCRV